MQADAQDIWWAFLAQRRFHAAYCEGRHRHNPSCPRHGWQMFSRQMRFGRMW